MELHGIFPAEDLSWQREANCLGVHPDLFFPERGASTKEAKEVCRACVVKDDCLEFALRSGEKFGIWGGMSERERRRLRRIRAQEPSRSQRMRTVWSLPRAAADMRFEPRWDRLISHGVTRHN